VSADAGPVYSRAVNTAEKYDAACKQLSKLSVLMSEVDTQDFLAITEFLAKVILRLEAGKECILVEDDDADYRANVFANVCIGANVCTS